MIGVKDVMQPIFSGTEAANIDGRPIIAGGPPAVLEILATPVERLIDTLRGYELKVNDENIAMLRLMLENGIALTKENILKMNQALKLTHSQEKALFLMQNNIRLTQSNAAQLDGLVSGQIRITDQLNNLIAAIEQLNDSALAAKLKQILMSGGKGNAAANEGAQGTGEPSAPGAQTPVTGNTAHIPGAPVTAAPTALGAAAQQTGQVGQGTQVGELAAAQQRPQGIQTVPETGTPQTAPAPTQGTQTAAGTQYAPQVAQIAQGSETQQSAPTPGVQTAQETGTQQSPQGTQTAATQLPVAGQQPAGQGAQAAQPMPEAPPATQAQSPQSPAQQTGATPQSAQQTGEFQPTPSQSAGSQSLPQNLLFRLAEGSPQEIDRYIENLREVLEQVRQSLPGRENPGTARIMQEVRALEAHLDFTAQIRNQLYMQLPLFHDGQQSLTALHIYRDAKKPGGGKAGASSALIALDTAGLGHFETYVQKNARSVHCQFRLESDKIVKLVRDNIHKLNDLLREHNYTLDSFTFMPPGEPYTLLDSPIIFEEGLTGHELAADKPLFDERA